MKNVDDITCWNCNTPYNREDEDGKCPVCKVYEDEDPNIRLHLGFTTNDDDN